VADFVTGGSDVNSWLGYFHPLSSDFRPGVGHHFAGAFLFLAMPNKTETHWLLFAIVVSIVVCITLTVFIRESSYPIRQH
jgi:hypothetical protein